MGDFALTAAQQKAGRERPRIAVIGGGITGLAAAHRLVELDPSLDVTLFEAGSCLGGVLQTVRNEGFLVECGADNFITNVPWALDLCRRIGIEDQLLETDSRWRRAFVVHKGRLRKIPDGFLIMAPSRIWPVLTTPVLSLRGKLRLVRECFVPPGSTESDESFASFATRRFGHETYQRLIQPLVGGIYTADPEKLSVQATMPRFAKMERDHGSLIRASWRQAAARRQADQSSSGARYSMFMTPRNGLSSLVEAVAARLPKGALRVNSPVERIVRKPGGGWALSIAGPFPQSCEVDALIVATPAYRAADLLADVDSELSSQLGQISHADCAVISLGYRRDQIAHQLDGFGFVVPHIEGRKILSGSFSSVKYPGRAPDDCVLVRVFIGGACQSELVKLGESQLVATATQELGQLLGIRDQPVFQHVSRWSPAMPQYHVGHCELIGRIESRASALPHLGLAGNAYHGVGIPHCIHSGEQVAERIAAELNVKVPSSS